MQGGLERRTVPLAAGPVTYALRRHPRSRGLRVTIDPRIGVVVSVPLASRRGWTSNVVVDARILAFLRERERWIVRHLAVLERERAARRAAGGVRDGGSVLYLGLAHRLHVMPFERGAGERGRRSTTVERAGTADGDELIVHRGARERRSTEAILKAWLKAKARLAIDAAVERHAAALGVRPTAVDLRDARSRWGSASKRGRLMLSWRLVLAPPDSLETVVVHELAHLRVFGHGPRFWTLVASRRPNHLADRAWLRRHGSEVHAALEPVEPPLDEAV